MYGRRGIEHRNLELEIIDDATGGEIVDAIQKANRQASQDVGFSKGMDSEIIHWMEIGSDESEDKKAEG